MSVNTTVKIDHQLAAVLVSKSEIIGSPFACAVLSWL